MKDRIGTAAGNSKEEDLSKRLMRCLIFALALTAWIAAPAAAQVRLKGEITGFVFDEGGEPLPGASVVLTGERLLQSSLSAVTNEKGHFRLLNLNPGAYVLEISLAGFNTLKLGNVRVSVGQSEPIRAVLAATKLAVRGRRHGTGASHRDQIRPALDELFHRARR